MARHIKKGDTVKIIAGDHKGMTGEVMKVIPSKNRILVKGINLAYKHVRPSQQNPQGGRIRVEQPINISNALPINTKSSQGTRVRFQTDKKGIKKRVAVDGTEIGIVRKSER